MSKTATFGYKKDSTTDKQVTIPSLDYANQFAVQEDEGPRCVITNLTCPIDQPETIRFQTAKVANVYAGSSIDPSVYATTRQGTSLVVQLENILRVTDTEDPSYQVDLPISVHTVVKVPNHSSITSEVVASELERLLSAFFDTDGTGTSRLDSLLRGSMKPSTM